MRSYFNLFYSYFSACALGHILAAQKNWVQEQRLVCRDSGHFNVDANFNRAGHGFSDANSKTITKYNEESINFLCPLLPEDNGSLPLPLTFELALVRTLGRAFC